MCDTTKSEYYTNKIRSASNQKEVYRLIDEVMYKKKVGQFPSMADQKKLDHDFLDNFQKKVVKI